MISADADQERRADGRRERVPQPRLRPVPERRGGEAAEHERAQHHHEDQADQVVLDRLARVLSNVLQVQRPALRDVRHRLPIHRPQIDVQPGWQLHRVLEPHTPVDERHVEVQRALVPGVDADLDLPDAELLRLRVRVQSHVRADERRHDRRDHDEGVSRWLQRARRPAAAIAAGACVSLRSLVPFDPLPRVVGRSGLPAQLPELHHAQMPEPKRPVQPLADVCGLQRRRRAPVVFCAASKTCRITWVPRPCRLAFGTVATKLTPQSPLWWSASATAAGFPS